MPVRAALLTDGPGPGGHFVLAHSDAGLSRGLEHGEQVVIVDPDGEFHAAVVHGIDFGLSDTHYVLKVGVRLPPGTVHARLARPAGDEAAGEAVEVDDVLDLLARLRDRPPPEVGDPDGPTPMS